MSNDPPNPGPDPETSPEQTPPQPPAAAPVPPPAPEGVAPAPEAPAPPPPPAPAPKPAPAPAASSDEEESSDEDLQAEIDSFDALIDQHLPGKEAPRSRGELLEAPIVDIGEEFVLVDLGGKAEAKVPLTDFPLSGGKRQVELGQVIQVVQMGRDADGAPRLSHAEARARAAEGAIREAMEKGEAMKGAITRTVKGGVMVDIGLSAFMPASQVDLFKIPDLSKLVGEEIEAYVIEYDERRRRAVLSRRKLLVEERDKERQDFINTLEVGGKITGKVKSSLDFGVFVDLGVIDGFIPREEVSYDRGTHPKEIVKAGEEIEAVIVKVDPSADKVTLSRKRLAPDPWDSIDDRYRVGQRIKGTVVAVQTYGAFVHLEEGVTGMIHASDISWTAGRSKPSDHLAAGQEVEVQILEILKDKQRMSLGLKQVEMDPWEGIEAKYPVGAKVSGTITSMTNYGVFVKLDEYIEGMCHVSDLSWEKRINHPREVVKSGQEVQAVVLKADPAGRRLSLGVKQVTESPMELFSRAHPQGSLVTGKVTRFAPFGAFVDLGNGLEGLIHISQIDEKRVELPENALSEGEEVTCKVVRVDQKNNKVSLSRKEAMRAQERERLKAYMGKKEDAPTGVTFGDLLNKARSEEQKPDEG